MLACHICSVAQCELFSHIWERERKRKRAFEPNSHRKRWFFLLTFPSISFDTVFKSTLEASSWKLVCDKRISKTLWIVTKSKENEHFFYRYKIVICYPRYFSNILANECSVCGHDINYTNCRHRQCLRRRHLTFTYIGYCYNNISLELQFVYRLGIVCHTTHFLTAQSFLLEIFKARSFHSVRDRTHSL